MTETNMKVKPIDSFVLIYKVLALTGFYKHLVKPKSRVKYTLHQMYRVTAFLIMVFYNLSHLIYIYEAGNDIDTIVNVMMIELPQLNVLAKYLAFNLGSSRLDKINEALMNDPMFLPTNEKEEEYLTRDKLWISSMLKRIYVCMTVCTSIWTLSYFYKRLQDPEGARIDAYIPFDTHTWLGYTMAVLLYTVLVLPWSSYGHITLDFAIPAYYLQAQTQLKIIKYNLERIVEVGDSSAEIAQGSRFRYKDLVYPEIKEQFVYNVRRYEKVVWYTEEFRRVVDKAIGFNLLTLTFGLCLIINRMSSADTTIPQLGFLTTFAMILLADLFFWCYFGGNVSEESTTLSTSLYLSEWWRLSGGFRRGMLVAMTRWARPLVPRVSSFVIVPLSLTTFIAIVRASYSLFSVLKAAKS